ncbi:hypothetical protein OIV19_20160 [Brucella sp. HL-2]|nr:hypothetical protein [Brucella sp. HL-2]MCV9909917.1 hypothetical protein [Brucella sp. HL-2]
MDNWLKGLVAAACIVVIGIGSVWSYDRYQRYVASVELAESLAEQAKIAKCKTIIDKTIPGSDDAYEALSCAKSYPALAWFTQVHEGALAYMGKTTVSREDREKARQRIIALQETFRAKESSSVGTEREKCFLSAYALYELGGPDALYIFNPSQEKVSSVRDCIVQGAYTEEEVNAFGKTVKKKGA